MHRVSSQMNKTEKRRQSCGLNKRSGLFGQYLRAVRAELESVAEASTSEPVHNFILS